MAARLMTKAGEGGILASYDTWIGSNLTINFEELEPIMVKGRDQPLAVSPKPSTLNPKP